MTDRSSSPAPRNTPEPPGNAPGLRYEALVKIASGGMATVFVGALRGPFGFEQLVAIKRPHEHLLEDPAFRDALIAEARLASRLRHAHVVDVRDIDAAGESIQIVMDYVEGATLFQLIQSEKRSGPRLPAGVAARIVLDACAGLHAAHELVNEDGERVGIVHRDVSPQNILVGIDGLARVTDFGVAKEEQASRPSTTQGTLKGKLGYMAPEYIQGRRPDRRLDVFGLGVVLWEALARRRLFRGTNEADTLERVLHEEAPRVGEAAPDIGSAFDDVTARALAKDPAERFQTVEEMAIALEEAARGAGLLASHAEVGRFVRAAAGEELARRRELVRERRASLRGAQEAAAKALPALEDTRAAGTISSVTILSDEAPTAIYEGRAAKAQPGAGGRKRSVMVAIAAIAGVVLFVAAAIALTSRSSAPEPQAAPNTIPGSTAIATVLERPPSPPQAPIEQAAEGRVAAEPAVSATAPAPTSTPTVATSAPPPAPKNKSTKPADAPEQRPAAPPRPTSAPTTTSKPPTSLPPNPYAR